MTDFRSSLARQGFVRPQRGRVVGGVCAGVGRRFGLTPLISRVLFIVLLMVLPGSQFLVYPLLWIVMPTEEDVSYADPTLPPSTV